MTEEATASLSELFAKDPGKMTNDDIQGIVRKLRDARKNFNRVEANGSKTPRSRRQKPR